VIHEKEKHLRASFASIILVLVFVDYVNSCRTAVTNRFTEVRLHLEPLLAEVDHLLLAFNPFVDVHIF
jgi:hypothetical protein